MSLLGNEWFKEFEKCAMFVTPSCSISIGLAVDAGSWCVRSVTIVARSNIFALGPILLNTTAQEATQAEMTAVEAIPATTNRPSLTTSVTNILGYCAPRKLNTSWTS